MEGILENFDIIIIGTGFASSFFLHSYLSRADKKARILVLERGKDDSHAWQLQNKSLSSIISKTVNLTPAKRWPHYIGFGGTSRAWVACTPRMMPNDLQLKSKYGIGVDWPITYDELEPYYTEAEIIMAVSGPSDGSPFPRSQPYPQPPHRFNGSDKLLKQAYPDLYFQQPVARARIATNNRALCCATGVCNLCPADAKFTVQNEMAYLYQDPRVNLLLEAEALAIETEAGQATGVRYKKAGVEYVAKTNLVVLGANAIFNPYLLQKSNLLHPLLGKRLHEQVSQYVRIDLDGVDNFQGSTMITGHGYMLYDGSHRSKHAACIIENFNVPLSTLRVERGKWLQRCYMKFIFEDLPSEDNYIAISEKSPNLPKIVHKNHSAYAQRGLDTLPAILPKLLAPLPVENITMLHVNNTEGHIQGTTIMGNDPKTSIVDKNLLHHQVRNLLILGSSVFPTCSPANPTLTLSALSLWAADQL